MDATAATARPNPGQLAFDVGDAATVSEGYRGPTVCKIVGITYRQLDYWARTGLVEPTVRRAEGSGSQRLYAFEDVLQIKIVKRLLDTGVSLQKVRMAIEELRARGKSVVEATLISDGTSVYTVDSDQQVLDLLRRGQGVFALSLEPVIDELRGEVSAFPAERIADRPSAMPVDTEFARFAQ
ncbi:MAG: MerR family transcriptional regulator [Nitriliruptoraceae bacterium]